MDQQPQVIVRNSVRHDLCLRGAVSVTTEGEGGVRFAAPAGVKDGWLDVDIVDIGTGGLGFISLVFIPRKTLLQVRVYGAGSESSLLLTVSARVQRVCMTDRRPAYLMGCSFDNLTPESRAALDALLASLAGMDPV